MMEFRFDRKAMSSHELLNCTAKQRMSRKRSDREAWTVLLLAEGTTWKPFPYPVELWITARGPRKRDPDRIYASGLIDALRHAKILEEDYSDQVAWVHLRAEIAPKYEVILRIEKAPAEGAEA